MNLSTSVDLKLAVGAVTQQVVVEANEIQLETENSELGGTVSLQQILGLPQVGRNAYNLALLQPGVIPEQNSALQTQINGGMANTSNLLLGDSDQQFDRRFDIYASIRVGRAA